MRQCQKDEQQRAQIDNLWGLKSNWFAPGSKGGYTKFPCFYAYETVEPKQTTG